MSTLPPYLVDSLRSRFGAAAEELLSGYPERRPVTLRVNRLKSDAEKVRAALEEAGLAFEPVPWYPDALLLPDAREADVQALPLYARGLKVFTYPYGLCTEEHIEALAKEGFIQNLTDNRVNQSNKLDLSRLHRCYPLDNSVLKILLKIQYRSLKYGG